MKKRFGRIIIGGILLLLFPCVSALAILEKSVNYHFFSKKVAVRIENYTKKNGTYIPVEDVGIAVMPGEFSSRIPVIYNEGMDCYVRVKISITSDKEPSVPITMQNIVGMSKKWILIGDYFYYKDVLLEDEVVEVFEGISMPQEWVETIDSGNQWEVQVEAEAIQAKHLIPDFRNQDPWGVQEEEFEILDAKEDEALEEVEEELKHEFIFAIESEVESFQIKIEESFQNMGDFVPGDEKGQEIKISNLDQKERMLYMKAEVQNDIRLLKDMEVTIWWKCNTIETMLYRGAAANVCDLLERVTLIVPGNAEGILRVAFVLSKEADNHCSVQEGSIRFLLSDNRIMQGNDNGKDDFVNWPGDMEELEDTKRPAHMDKESKHENESTDGTLTVGGNLNVQTGDDNKIWNAIVGVSIGGCLFFLCIWKGKRGSHDL